MYNVKFEFFISWGPRAGSSPKEHSAVKLWGAAYTKSNPTMTSLSSIVQENLVTFVLAVHAADILVMHLAMVRIMESTQCVVAKEDMVVGGLGIEKHLS